MWLRWFAFPALALAGIGVVSLALLGFVILLAYPNLPSIEALTEYSEDPAARLHCRRPADTTGLSPNSPIGAGAVGSGRRAAGIFGWYL